jgi:hypothetical protein
VQQVRKQGWEECRKENQGHHNGDAHEELRTQFGVGDWEHLLRVECPKEVLDALPMLLKEGKECIHGCLEISSPREGET